jgi:hypothetical protein
MAHRRSTTFGLIAISNPFSGFIMGTDTTNFWSAVAAIAAAATVFVSYFSALFSWRSLRAQSEPKVILYVKHDPDHPTLLYIVIENIGRDVAEDVTFTPSRPIPAEGFGLISGANAPSKVMVAGPLVNGIRALGPGAPRLLVWGQIGGLLDAIGNTPIDISITYRHGRRKLTGATHLEVESFVHTDASETPALRTAISAESVAKSLSDVSRTLGKLSALITQQKQNRPEERIGP